MMDWNGRLIFRALGWGGDSAVLAQRLVRFSQKASTVFKYVCMLQHFHNCRRLDCIMNCLPLIKVPLKSAIVLLSLASLSMAAHASDYTPLMKARKYVEAERLADSRLEKDPANPAAIAAKVDAILAAGTAGRFEEAAKLGERCVSAHPQVAVCHLTLGNALGAKAVANGVMSALGYAGTIRDAFKKAVELDPQDIDARMALMSYYLQAPSIVGGGTGKARTLATQTAAVNPEAGKLMQARVDIDAEQYGAAEAALLSMPVSANEALADGQRDVMTSMGGSYLKAKRYGDAERVLREAIKRFPDSENAPFVLARVQQEQGKHREALAGFEQLLTKAPRGAIWYRIGQSQQALGDKPKAATAYEHAVALADNLPKSARSDAEAQLKALRQK